MGAGLGGACRVCGGGRGAFFGLRETSVAYDAHRGLRAQSKLSVACKADAVSCGMEINVNAVHAGEAGQSSGYMVAEVGRGGLVG